MTGADWRPREPSDDSISMRRGSVQAANRAGSLKSVTVQLARAQALGMLRAFSSLVIGVADRTPAAGISSMSG